MTGVLIVGAGFAGAVTARELAAAGIDVDVIDRRPHIAGNAYDEVAPNGTRIHRYGPHLLHTNMAEIVAWLRRFGRFVPYEHHVQALLNDGRCVPLPINRDTVNAVFDLKLQTAAAMQAFLREQALPSLAPPRNAADHLYAQIGRRLTDLFFRPYTEKMWGLTLEQLDTSVVQRIPLRFDTDSRYFPNDVYQILPEHGYTALFAAILDHPRIRVGTGTEFAHGMLNDYRHCFNSMAIDTFFDEQLGPLPYRSLRFHHREEPATYRCGETPVVNFTDARPYTRQTDWSRLPHHGGTGPLRSLTLEEPCDYRDNDYERYYPVKDSGGVYEALYQRYRRLAAQEPRVTFIGRCGTYRYLDMHQVINQALIGARAWLRDNGLR